MRSFVIGKVLEPELRGLKGGKQLVEFGILVGRESSVFAVWDSDEAFSYARTLRDGDCVIAVVNSALDDKGRLKAYVNRLAAAPEGLRESLLDLFRSAVPDNRVSIPEPPQVKKAGA